MKFFATIYQKFQEEMGRPLSPVEGSKSRIGIGMFSQWRIDLRGIETSSSH